MTYVLRVETGTRPLLANQAHKLHYREVSAMRAEYRALGWAIATRERVPQLDPMLWHVEARGCYLKGTLPDPSAIAPTVKGLVDGLVDAGVFSDDALVEEFYRRPIRTTWLGIELFIVEASTLGREAMP